MKHRVPTHDLIVLAFCLSAMVAAAALLRTVPDISETTAALAFLLVVLIAATLGALWMAAVVAVAAMLTLNFVFIPPLGTLTVADPQNWVALIVFLVVAGVGEPVVFAGEAPHARGGRKPP